MTDKPNNAVRCPACYATNCVCASASQGESVYRCQLCRLRFLWPQPGQEELDSRYGELYFVEDPQYAMSSGAYLEQIVGRHIRRVVPRLDGLKVLDFGCGDGKLLEVLGGHGCDVYGVEWSDEARTKAMRDSGRPIWKSIDEMPASRDFDLVVMNEVIEHLPLPRQALERIYERIRRGGGCYVSTPNFAGLKARLLGRRWSEYRNTTHLCYFDASSLRRLGRLVGFGQCVRLSTRVRFGSMGRVQQAANTVLSALRMDSSVKMFLRK